MPDAPPPLLTAEGRASWHAHLDQFKREVYPLLSEHGLTVGEAMILFELNKIANYFYSIQESLIDPDDPEARKG